MARFDDRKHAGDKLAELLGDFRDRENVHIVALSIGALPVARAIADAIDAPLTLLPTRELAGLLGPRPVLGAIAPPDVRVLDFETAHTYQISDQSIDVLEKREREELERIEQRLGDNQRWDELEEGNLVLVLDCLRSPSVVQAALQALDKSPDQVVIAAPFAAESALTGFSEENVRVLHREEDKALTDCFAHEPEPDIEQARDFLDEET